MEAVKTVLYQKPELIGKLRSERYQGRKIVGFNSLQFAVCGYWRVSRKRSYQGHLRLP